MKRRSRTFQVAWWSGLTVCVLIVSLGIVSFFWAVGFQHRGMRYEWFVLQGNLYVNVLPPGYVSSHPRFAWAPGFAVHPAALFPPWLSLPRLLEVQPGWWHLLLPLYLPVLLLGGVLVYPCLPSVHRRWRRNHGLCIKCGYDLRGNVSGVCSECGEPVKAKAN